MAIDYSQYLRNREGPTQPTQPAPQNQQIDFSQYRRVDPNRPNVVTAPQQAQIQPEMQQPQKPIMDKLKQLPQQAVRAGTQALIGGLQAAAMPYDIAAMASKSLGEAISPVLLRKNLFKELEDINESQYLGVATPEDLERATYIKNLINNPKVAQEIALADTIPNFDVASLIELGAKQVGVDLTPKDASDHAARIVGMLYNPANARALLDPVKMTPSTIRDIASAIAPSPKAMIATAGAIAGMEAAAADEYGPMGTMAMMGLGQLIGEMTAGGAKGIARAIKSPGSVLQKFEKAKATASDATRRGIKRVFGKPEQQQIINDLRAAGLQGDLGTVTNNRLIQMVQNALEQSGFSGPRLDAFRKQLSADIANQYNDVTSTLRGVVSDSYDLLGQQTKSELENIINRTKADYQAMYRQASDVARGVDIYAGNVGSRAHELLDLLEPGAVKSPDNQRVINLINDLLTDIEYQGTPKAVNAQTLINNRSNLKSIINYSKFEEEGVKKLLHQLVKEIDTTLTTQLGDNKQFINAWQSANKKFAEYAGTYLHKDTLNFLRGKPENVMAQLGSIDGIRRIRRALSATPEGQQIYNNLAATKMQELVGRHMLDSTTQQVKLGTFEKLLDKTKNRDIARALLGQEQFNRLARLQKASGRLADVRNKFFNASQSGRYAVDIAIASKIYRDVTALLTGNPWPLMRTASTYGATRSITKLITDPRVLQYVEESIMAPSLPPAQMQRVSSRLVQRAQQILTPEEYAALTYGLRTGEENTNNQD